MSPLYSQRVFKVFLVVYQSTQMTVAPNPIDLVEILERKTLAAYNHDYDNLMPRNNFCPIRETSERKDQK